MKIKYIVKAASIPRCLFLSRDVEMDNGQIAPFAFRDCAQQDWQIAKFDTKAEAIKACEEARQHGGCYTPVILETFVQENKTK